MPKFAAIVLEPTQIDGNIYQGIQIPAGNRYKRAASRRVSKTTIFGAAGSTAEVVQGLGTSPEQRIE